MAQEIDISYPDWASAFMEEANGYDKIILPATITPLNLAKFVASIANENGGYILLGAYSEKGYGSEFKNVPSELVETFQNFVEGVEIEIQAHKARLQNIYLLNVKKSESLAFADGSPYVLKNGEPSVMAEREILENLGLGIDSALINMISEQIIKQSSKVDELSSELKEKSKLKNQVPGLIVGGIIGWILSILLNFIVGVV